MKLDQLFWIWWGRLLCKCALLSLFESISVLKKEFWIAIDISDRSTAHMVLLSASVFFFVIWIVIEIALAIIAYIYVCVFHSIPYTFHYWLFIACFPFRRICVSMIWTMNVVICIYRFIVTIHVKQSLNDWTYFIYFTESSICLINR